MHSKNPDAAEMLRSRRSLLKENDMIAYLCMMAVRLLELHRVLKPTGSIYLHCDSTASHYLKLLRFLPVLPNVILVAACRSEDLSEICSLNSFVIDARHGYRTRPAEAGEWEQGVVIESQEMDDPVRRTLKQEYARPAFLRPIPIAPREGEEFQGYKYRGNEFRRRGDWVGALNFAASDDGKAVVLAGVDKQKFPNQEPAYVAAAIHTRPSGLVATDVFAADPSHHIAALELDCHRPDDTARRRISLVNSRWLAIGLDPFLQKMLLFDFKASGEQAR
jgi:hypothetical protein